jgi:chromosome segregation ATPase
LAKVLFRRRIFWRIENLETTLRARDAQVADLKEQNERRKVDLDNCAQAHVALEQELGAVKTRASRLESDLDAAQKSSAVCQADLRARDSELSKLRAELTDAHAQKKNLLADAEKFAAGAVTAAATIKGLEGDRAKLEAQLA